MAQGLETVEGATLIVTYDLDTLGISLQTVGTGNRFNASLGCQFFTEIDGQANTLSVGSKELHVVGKFAFLVDYLDSFLQVESVSSIHIQEMWCRAHDESVMIQFLARNHVHVLLFRTLATQVLCLSALCKCSHQEGCHQHFSSHK